jgi:hydroxypyruvate isomerase
MPRFAANLSMLFTELPLEQRVAAAAAAGFKAVEIQFPYALPAQVLARQLEQYQLPLVLHNLPAGDWAAGERGIACLPERRAEFRASVQQAIDYALELGTPRLNCLAGICPPQLNPAAAQACLHENIEYAAQQLSHHNLTLMVEAINTFDIPGFFICHSHQVFDLIDQCALANSGNSVNPGNVLMQYDIYHMQRMGEAIAATLSSQLAKIGHIQIADAPGRNEPGTGAIPFPDLFALIDQLDYKGWVGCEYQPRNTTLNGLVWMDSI